MRVRIRVVLGVVLLVGCLSVIYWRSTAPQRSLRQCKLSLKSVGLALQAYHSSHGSFPPAFSKSQHPQSWRVSLLPWLGHQSLYDSYTSDEAWDGHANSKLLALRPMEYKCPEVIDDSKSSYRAILGVQTAWPYETPSRLLDFTDGTSNTAMIADLHEFATEWTRPTDTEYNDAIKAAGRGSHHLSGDSVKATNLLFADGSVRSVFTGVDESILRMIMTPSAGRPLLEGRDALERSVAMSQAFSEPIDCDSLNATTLWPVSDIELAAGKTVLYCPTLALAWQRYLQQQSQVGFTDLGGKLRDSPFSAADISENALQIEINSSTVDGPSVACSLKKHLAFAAVFDSFHLPLTFVDTTGAHKVKSFGVTSHWVDWRFALAQVKVHDYRSPDDFVISITNLNAEDLVLAKIPQPRTLDAGINEVVTRIRGSRVPPNAREVVAEEDLVIPALELSVFGNFEEQLNHPSQPSGSRILRARQELQFRLDERGAVVHSEAEVIGENGAYEYTPGTRTFIFDKPFLVMLRESPIKQPYFAGWIGNSDLMIPRETP